LDTSRIYLTYTYDYAGNRTSKTTNGEYTKAGMEQTLSKNGVIRFDLTNMDDISGVLNGASYRNAITSYELNYIRDNWGRFSNNVKFYSNGMEVYPPWQ
jgi:YD repeat-containing protein